MRVLKMTLEIRNHKEYKNNTSRIYLSDFYYPTSFIKIVVEVILNFHP